MKRVILSSGLMVLTLAACTKELPKEEVFKEPEVMNKSLVDTKTEYIYSSSMLNASRSSSDALPFSSGDTKRVRLKWDKEALQVIETERDARFKGNSTNDKLVLSIPVDHIDYQCAKDKYGECTNSEEEKNDVLWSEKTKFKIKAEASKSAAIELLPILIDRTLGGSCYEEIESKVQDIKMEADAINIDIMRTFRTNIDCLSQLDVLADATVSAVYHYSMVKVNSVTSKDFKPLAYSVDDQNTFGFFSTERQELDADNNPTEAQKKTLMNHWNPNRSDITYYLSEEFLKPENAVIKDLTYKTIGALNTGLAQSGAQFRITLKEGEHKNPGDIRNSMIILVEDPVASSVIGYGPQTEDPATGEIISARTVMFLGTIKKYIGSTYNDIIKAKNELQAAEKAQKEGKVEANGIAQLKLKDSLLAKIRARQSMSLQTKLSGGKTKDKNKVTPKKLAQASAAVTKDMNKEVKNYTKNRNAFYAGDLKAQFKYLQEAKNCSLGLNDAEVVNAAISPRLIQKFEHYTQPWEQLSAAEKQNVIDIILPEIWIPTLIHEMGHNLGLRHNFQGSEDKENFYSQKELQDLGIDHDIPFSSVMEYGDDLKALPVLGKYDVAALRYGYARKVELSNGEMVDVDSLSDLKKNDAKLELKNYGFCTDEHLGINAGCRQFDLGTSYTDIVKNEIQTYFDRYDARNFRHGRSNMSLFDDPSYASGISRRFANIRLMQEVYERFKFRFGLEDDSEYWTTVPVLADLKQASTLAAQFLIDVMQTPDLTCVVAEAATPNEVYDVIPLVKLDAEQISCFNASINEKFVVIGQYGKKFNSQKDPNSQNAYADQIDVRGYWIDKLMASRMLFKRTIGVSTLDQNTDNFMDRAELSELVAKSVQDILLNRAVSVQQVQMKSGEVLMAELPVDTADTHVIEKPIHQVIAQRIGIPNQNVSFSQLLSRETAANMVAGDRELSGKGFADSLKVVRARAIDNIKVPKTYPVLDLGLEKLIAAPTNVIATEALGTRTLILALDKIDRSRLVEIYLAKEEKTQAGEVPAAEKVAWDMDNETLRAYLVGALGTADFYTNLVNVLPN